MSRKPPRDRNRQPYWTAPRAAASARRNAPGAPPIPGAGVIERYFKAARRHAVALVDAPWIRPLTRADRTQVLWSKHPGGGGGYYAMPTERFVRYRNLISIPEGTPLCN